MTIRRLKIVLFLGTIAIFTQFYTNCGGFNAPLQIDMASISPQNIIPSNHPILRETNPPEEKLQLAPRTYVYSVLLENFSSIAFPVTGLQRTLNTWVLNRPGLFGGNCNLYDAPSGLDCGGDESNASLPVTVEASTMRASYKTQVCEQILSQDNAVRAILEKIGSSAHEPNESDIGKIYSLFRRGWDPESDFVASLLDMDTKISSSASEMDRWRLVILMICEDPIWEAL